jgi:hypothetical protein
MFEVKIESTGNWAQMQSATRVRDRGEEYNVKAQAENDRVNRIRAARRYLRIRALRTK